MVQFAEFCRYNGFETSRECEIDELKFPIDPTPYPRDPRSQPIAPGISDGGYVYVRDGTGTIYVVPDGPHLHPKVLGRGDPAMYAGDLTIRGGNVADLTNLSGTFEFDDESGLLEVAKQIAIQGVAVQSGAVRFFPPDGSRPVVLN
ncbi:MAG TPA: hypothetical protein VGL71_11345 [Urbifossiella sp.]